MIKPTDKPEITLVYTKNGCPKCEMTKKQLTAKGVDYEAINIETSGEFEEYIEMLKQGAATMSMPVVFPAKSTGLASWSDFQPQKIKELAEAVK